MDEADGNFTRHYIGGEWVTSDEPLTSERQAMLIAP
jgi:hypothetical protein